MIISVARKEMQCILMIGQLNFFEINQLNRQVIGVIRFYLMEILIASSLPPLSHNNNDNNNNNILFGFCFICWEDLLGNLVVTMNDCRSLVE